MNVKVTVLRGLPGCGKSTYVKNALTKPDDYNPFVCSTDDFFMENGVYKFDPNKIGLAHANCFYRYIHALSPRTPGVPFPVFNHIVVDNTNCSTVEIAPYMLGAAAFGVDATIVTIKCDIATALKRNVHEVPSDVLIKMQDELVKPLPPWWNHTEITL